MVPSCYFLTEQKQQKKQLMHSFASFGRFRDAIRIRTSNWSVQFEFASFSFSPSSLAQSLVSSSYCIKFTLHLNVHFGLRRVWGLLKIKTKWIYWILFKLLSQTLRTLYEHRSVIYVKHQTIVQLLLDNNSKRIRENGFWNGIEREKIERHST